MSFGTVVAGVVLIVITVVFMTVGISTLTFQPTPSDIARPLSDAELKGREIYMGNGCMYCHTQYVRPQDWNAAGGGKAARPAQAGDYVFQKTMLLGTERTGPDLSQEGGVHPDSWHRAHFSNPRYVSPNSIMPQFSYIQGTDLTNLIAYVQGLGGKAASVRYNQLLDTQQIVLDSWNKSYEAHLQQIKSMVPTSWQDVKSAMPPTPRSLVHGKQIFLQNCIGCHGVDGNGRGPASQFGMKPDPADFTRPELQLAASDGQYYQYLLFGLPGSAMPAWGDYLTVNDIWDVINFLRTVPKGGLKVPESQLQPSLMLQYDKQFGASAGGYQGPQPTGPDQLLDNPYCKIAATPSADCNPPTSK
jgi:cbb3-type cytochrome c oxidase subunit II